ncbi:AzlC family ABC transporter permease [Streptococcus pluranimalium]|uniref:AzlC family ABC transporter permease n=1 Tax=Streptococcus pluranimalium TaxID=82348 RepID=UPI003F662690
MDRIEFLRGAGASLPTAVGYVSIGLACGVVGASSGLTAWEMGLMSIFIYAGSAQFAFATLVLANASLVSLTITIFLINLRHLLMSLHVTTLFKGISLSQGIGTLLTDESYGVLLGEQVHRKDISTSWMHGNNIIAYVTWILVVVLGTLIGSYIPDPTSLGLDFALVAMFVSIFESQLTGMLRWLAGRKIAMILGAMTVSYLLLTVVFSESIAVLVATLIGCAVGVMIDDN